MKQLSKSWIELKPLEMAEVCKEPFEDYHQRIQENRKLKNIPREVLQHWIYDQHDFDITIENYAWLNFYELRFNKVYWPTESLAGINLLTDHYRRYVKEKSELKSIQCLEDEKYWEKKGTWRVPPIIFDVHSLNKKVARWSKIIGPFQFVDGHTRLGNLYALINISKQEETNLADSHCIYLMSQN